ncbi:hypothetical protein LAZ67_16002308 [Cordylochernes scorpioides]|uniref:Reverse transcriptase domain-containing protein n=1 Tax=Cordylochernes scorpioides TaxID=51811 RepID=A0ABY6LBY4_9ARAC|nr:hypothetical protein LAZ67_16002308 [Cordylochernes scorpioides]
MPGHRKRRNVGATRVTSARVDRRIPRQAVAAPQATCTAILQHMQDTLDHSISTRTISHRLVANGLHSCRPLRRLPLTPPNRRQRLDWCRARSTWMTEWHRVVFSDESRFCLSSDSRRVRVWRRRGERSNPAAIVERPTVRQRGIMVWGAIAYDSRSPLLRIQGTMTAQRYVDDVLRPVTFPYLQGVPNALYQQDNARPHTARISQQALQDVQMLPWPPYSPDLSPIEHVWDIIGRRLHALPQPRSEDELWQMVEREWRAIPQDAIRTLIDSLPRRVAACIANLKTAEQTSTMNRVLNDHRFRTKPLPKSKRQCLKIDGLLCGSSAIWFLMSVKLPSTRFCVNICARWVPKMLTEDHKRQRVERPRNFSIATKLTEFLDSITTGDETWVHYTTPEIKGAIQAVEAHFFAETSKGLLLCDFMRRGITIHSNRYCETLKQLRRAIQNKRRGMLTKGVRFHHDNARPHTACQTTALDDYELEEAVLGFLRGQAAEFFDSGFHKRIRPLINEAFSVRERPPDSRAWIFGSGLEDDDLAILASAKSIIYRYFVQVGLTGGASPGKEGSPAGAHPSHDHLYFSLFISLSLSAVRPRGARAPRFLEIEMEAMEISNVFSILAESQDDDKFDGGTPTQKRPTNAEKSAEQVFKPDSKNTFSIKQTTGDYVNQAAGKKQADANWAERVEASEKQSALESDWKIPKSNKRKGRDSPTQQAKVAKAETIVAGPSLQPRREVRDAVTHIRASRQQQDLAKARSAAATFDHCCFIEWIPDFHQVQYMKALEQMLGKSSVHQLMKMSGHVLVTLPSAEKAERLIEEGLTIGSTLLRAFPYRKRAEKIIIGNLPIAVKDDDIVATLRPYCKVASIAYEIVTCEGYSWTTGSREAFIFMNEGLKIHQLPVKLDIKSRGETTPAYISYGVKCSKCHRQGHRRASCPRRDLEERSTRQPTSQHGSLPPSTQTSPSSQPAATTPAAIGHNGPEKAPAKNVHILMKPPPANKTSGTKALPAAAEVATSSKERPPNIAAPILTIAPGSRIPLKTNPLSKEDESSTDKRSTALRQLEEVLKQLPDTVFENTEAAGMEKEKIVQAIISERNLKKFLPDQKPEQLDSLINLIGTFVDRVEDKACHLYKRLTHLRQHAVDVAFVQETNVLALNNIRDLCLGYSAVFAPSSTPRGSGLSVVAAPGVTVLWHRVLWPGKIAIASVKIRGLETRVINCHLSHTPEERHLQLQIIAEEAIREDAWVLGDINISEESSSDIGSGAVEAFAELLDRTALVDIAAIFDAAHLPTRVASYGSRVDAARLDRVLIPSRLSGRVTRYWTLNYRNSDHRAILLQVGDPPSPSAPSISALLRSAPVIERIEALLSEASQEIEGNPTGDLWGKWGKLKRELVEDIKCLYVPRVEDEDYVTRASRFLRSRLEAETVEADYPSLPELGRALRVRQHRAELTTVFDAQGNLCEGMSLRRYVFNSFRERFNGSTCSPEDIAGFLEGATECITLEDSDPLHRADISLNEVEVAISRLPQGKAAGWDGIPCELVKGFEDFFGGVIHQVLAESKLRGTLPESSRRNIICLVPKAHGGPGLSGYRPISLPTADYRIVSGVLLSRLRRHLPAIVPDCQTYAVPGRCPSWNIACVSDEVALAFKNKTPLAVISTDLQSAFDNVDREFLASQLRTIGLPLPFMEWLHLLYAEADATIKVNGNFTRPFKMRRGLRQGCACSAALFSIFTGPLLRHLERILGRGNVLAYADDILLLIREDWQFERVKTIFDEFRRASGVSVNFPKSKGLWCGAWRDRADSPLGISWSASSITVLGCEITSGHGTSVQENHLLGILERAISRWSPFVRGFSLVGRARAANSLVLAAVLHHLHGYLPGDATIAKLQARLTRFVWGSCHRAAWLPGGLLARPVSVGGVGLLDIRTQLQLACFKGVQAASGNGGKNAYSWLVESGAWMTPLSSGSWLLPRRRRLLDLWEQASSILGLNHRVVPAPTLLNLPLVGACRFLATPSLRAPSRWRGVRVRDLAGPAPPPVARPTRSACDDAAALGAFCQRLVADNATSVYRERTLEEAVVLRGTATPFLRISTRTARRMLERPRLAALPISRFLRRWAPVVGVPSASTPCSSLRRCSFGGHAADIALRLALHALPHPGHPASSQPVCIACGSSDLSLAHRYWSCSAVRPLIREAFSIIGRPPDLQSWIFAVGLEDHAITISSAAKHAIYVFFVDREMRGVAGDPLAIFHHTLQRWQRRHVHSCIF